MLSSPPSTMKAIVDRHFPMEHAAEAPRYVESGAKRGAVVIRMNPGAEGGPERRSI